MRGPPRVTRCRSAPPSGCRPGRVTAGRRTTSSDRVFVRRAARRRRCGTPGPARRRSVSRSKGSLCRFHMTTVTHMAVKRRVPKVRDLAPLIQFKRPQFDATKRRLDAALHHRGSAAHRQTAHPQGGVRLHRRRVPRTSFPLQRARQAFRDIEFHPTILRDVTNVTAGWNVLGQPVVLPFGIAPTGFTRLMHTEGEIAGAAGGGQGRHSVLAVHARHLRDRGPGDRCSPGPEMVSAVHVAGPGALDGVGASARPTRDSTPCWPPSTSRFPAPGCATTATG